MRDELALLREARPDAAGPSPELARATKRQLMSEIAPHAGRRREIARRPLVLIACAAVAAVAAIWGVSVSGPDSNAAWAAALVRVAETAPRLLVDAPGWSVTRADEFGVGYGEMTFSNGVRQLELDWQRSANFGSKLADLHSGYDALGRMSVQGAEARLFRGYAGPPPSAPGSVAAMSSVVTADFVATWRHDGYGLQVRGAAPDLETFTALVGALHEVSVDAWLSAMPASVVKPEGRRKVVLAMLEGVPLPPGFNVAPLLRGEDGTVHDRYQLGAQVTGAVGCAWLDRWVAARRTGDASALRQAIGALKTTHEWRVLREMQTGGAYPRVFWEYADAAVTNGRIQAGKQLTVEESYHDALGCPAG
jgi:hypothetical protein